MCLSFCSLWLTHSLSLDSCVIFSLLTVSSSDSCSLTWVWKFILSFADSSFISRMRTRLLSNVSRQLSLSSRALKYLVTMITQLSANNATVTFAAIANYFIAYSFPYLKINELNWWIDELLMYVVCARYTAEIFRFCSVDTCVFRAIIFAKNNLSYSNANVPDTHHQMNKCVIFPQWRGADRTGVTFQETSWKLPISLIVLVSSSSPSARSASSIFFLLSRVAPFHFDPAFSVSSWHFQHMYLLFRKTFLIDNSF